MASQANRDSSLEFHFDPHNAPLGAVQMDSEKHGFTAPAEMPTFDLLSDSPLPAIPADPLPLLSTAGRPNLEPAARADGSAPSKGDGKQFWFEGEVLMCACPDCSAPMAVRLWLMVADCWRCTTSIEMTEEQEREIQELLKERKKEIAENAVQAPPVSKRAEAPKEAKSKNGAATKLASSPPVPRSKETRSRWREQGGSKQATKQKPTTEIPSRRQRSTDGETRNREQQPAPPPPPQPAPPSNRPAERVPAAVARTQRRIREVAEAGSVTATVRKLLGLTPAWLVSLVVHFIVLTILALLTLTDDEKDPPTITLSTAVSKDDREGGDVQVLDPTDREDFALPLPSNVDVENEVVRETLIRADQDARDIQMDPDATDPNLTPIAVVKSRIVSDEKSPRRTFAARDPRVRVEMVKNEGGTTLTEAAVARALRWLSKHQHSDGSWGLHDFNKVSRCNCNGAGSIHSHAAGTYLTLLPFLGAGQTHLTGKYKSNVARGLRWMMNHQREDGFLSPGGEANPMYSHGQGAIVLCEAYAMEGDDSLREAAQKSIDFIVASQYHDGGWRYEPKPLTQKGDLSVVGWQLMALQSARTAGLKVPEETLQRASHFLDTVRYGAGRNEPIEHRSLYTYQRGERIYYALTAEALLCRMYLGWTKDRIEMKHAINWLMEKYPPSPRVANMYYWYYATQTMHHYGGPQWEEWNIKMRDILVRSQEIRGHQAGSWSPILDIKGYPKQKFEWAGQGGRIYVTALAACTLEVYYRHLPIFKQIDLK